eukprot:NODE_451_length_2218_cov_30.095648_g418_i0.p1 GENE.NODE_451_length_2218_cov_30.095648_g418_i0~~NODE_451_length_2218_cov_30.095648_g418_i0.p1  ORF type:complete len:706 (-),score=199.16 NODE_451_length_2218_cov_30.095648_g418_i0:101-2152(-)
MAVTPGVPSWMGDLAPHIAFCNTLHTTPLDPDAISVGEIDDNLDDILEGQLAEVLEKGHNLKEYGAQVAAELHAAEEACVDDYIRQCETIATLYTQINSCDQILESFETIVESFRAELGTLSEEMKQLQDSTASMSTKTTNRKAACAHLEVCGSLFIPDEMHRALLTSEVDDTYLHYVAQLEQRMQALESNPVLQDSAVKVEFLPKLVTTAAKVASKLSQFLTTRLGMLLEPYTTIGIHQQTICAKYTPAMRFLCAHAKPAADTIRKQYIENMGKHYCSVLKKLYKDFERHKISLGSKSDILVPRSAFDSKPNSQQKPANELYLSLDTRLSPLQALEWPPGQLLISPASQLDGNVTFVEIFSKLATSHLNIIMQEATFSQFFTDSQEPHLLELMAKATAFLEDKTSRFLCSTYDLTGVALPVLPQTTGNHSALKHLNIDPNLKVAISYHPCLRRYCLMASHLNLVNAPLGSVSPNTLLLSELAAWSDSLRQLLSKLAARFSAPIIQAAFLINNHATVLEAFDQNSIPDSNPDYVKYMAGLTNAINLFVREEYAASPFAPMLRFVDAHESNLSDLTGDEEQDLLIFEHNRVEIDENEVHSIVTIFHSSWCSGMSDFYAASAIFHHPRTFEMLLQSFFTLLLDYNCRLRDMIYKCYPHPPLRTKMIPNSILKHEIATKYIRNGDA